MALFHQFLSGTVMNQDNSFIVTYLYRILLSMNRILVDRTITIYNVTFLVIIVTSR